MTQSLACERDDRSSGPAAGRVRPALGLAHALLAGAASGPPAWEDRLHALADAFQAAGAGVAALVGGVPVVRHRAGGHALARRAWPWEEWPGLPAAIRETATAQQFEAEGHSLLVTGVCHLADALWLVWLEDAPGREWSVDESAALTLAGLALARVAAAGHDAYDWSRWQDRARAEQRLDDLSVLVARLVHDFGNVLTGIIGFTELGLLHLPPGSPAHRQIQEVYDAAQQGVQLINRLNLTCPRAPGVPAPVRVPEILAAEADHARATGGPAAPVSVEAPADLPPVAMEAAALQQVLAALLDNALRAAGPQGRVTVSACRTEATARDCLDLLGSPAPGPFVRLTVADTGPGFSAEARRRVFAEPFFSTRPRHRGMGLVSVYAQLRACGGGLRLEHGTAGGTRVHAYLPLARSTGSGTGQQ